jgi:hypothetical protein
MEVKGDIIIKQSAVLRGQYKFDEAIKLIENNIDSIDPDIHLNAWLEAFYAAKEKGDKDLTKKYAQAVANEDPDVPSIQDYL